MSKYIIEIEEKPLCVFDKDTQTYFPRLWRVKGFNSLVLDEEGLSRLEELNSDYINEHFSDLQDTAYQKGINDGSLDVKQRVEGAYQRGLDDAWEAARKIAEMWETIDNDELLEIFGLTAKIGESTIGTLFKKQTASEAIAKLKAYEEKQDDKPIIGEVVERYLNGKLDSTGIYLGEDGDYWNCLFWTGAVFGTFAYPKNQFKKTEKHVDIDKILEGLRYDN